VIRGGTVVDGSGAPGVRADVAVAGDRITCVGEVDGRSTRTVAGQVFMEVGEHTGALAGTMLTTMAGAGR